MNVTEEIRKGVKALYQSGDIVEVRAFGKNGEKRVGRYKFGWDLVKAIEAEDVAGHDVYYVLNPTSLPPAPMADNAAGTKELDVPRRKHFLLDFDPIRQHKIATDIQYNAALSLSIVVFDLLRDEMKGVEPIQASSGNGVHLLVPIDFPNDIFHKELIARVQKSISNQYSIPEVHIDCFPDAARLVRAYGTLNKKGTETAELKWRRSHIL